MLKHRTIFIIISLISLLFLQIEAANAGLLSKWRLELEQALSPFMVVGSGVALILVTLLYFAVFDKSLNIKESSESESQRF